MEFEWDEDKNEENFAKHGFDFEHAIQIFDGPIRQYVDARPWGEQRIAPTGGVTIPLSPQGPRDGMRGSNDRSQNAGTGEGRRRSLQQGEVRQLHRCRY